MKTSKSYRSIKQKRRAFTLLEILISIGIISVLIGLISAGAVQAKKSALSSSEMSEMHQLGIAGELYSQEGGVYPLEVQTVVQGGLAPTSICRSPLDPYSDGFANEWDAKAASQSGTHLTTNSVTSYPRSFLGPGDFGYDQVQFRSEIYSHRAAGWLVSLTQSKPYYPFPSVIGFFPQGTYTRLMMDGSVSNRTIRMAQTKTGEPMWRPRDMFFDEP